MSRTTEQFTLGNISNVWSNTASWREKSFFEVNKENTVTSTVWMIPTVPNGVRKQRWTYRRKPETVQNTSPSSNYRAKHTTRIHTTVHNFGAGKVSCCFERRLLSCLARLHLFVQQYNKSCSVAKYCISFNGFFL